jgi:hypothetical protein
MKAEIGSIMVRGQLRKKVPETPIPTVSWMQCCAPVIAVMGV